MKSLKGDVNISEKKRGDGSRLLEKYQGKTISNENRFFPVKKNSQGKPCFHYRIFFVKVCSVTRTFSLWAMWFTL